MSLKKAAFLPLRTTLETRTQNAVISVYFTSVPVKKASGALGSIRGIMPKEDDLDLQHLRRVAKYADVPEHVRASIVAARSQLNDFDNSKSFHEVLIIIGSTKTYFPDELVETLSPLFAPVTICSAAVPLLSPTSQEQASLWTSQYWPTVYKKSNPFGPHPSIVSRAEEEFRDDAGKWMDLAAEAAGYSSEVGHGEAIGVVIVERRHGTAYPLAIAGDSRWLGWDHDGLGNPVAHAVLRAIAMVANGLREPEEIVKEEQMAAGVLQVFKHENTTPIENGEHLPSSSGYLCHNLEIYCTHEPCVMCSMAILHSRFGKVIFQQEMRITGGLCAEGTLGHGLFWRKELNWQLLAWQMIPKNVGKVRYLDKNINV